MDNDPSSRPAAPSGSGRTQKPISTAAGAARRL